MLSLLVSSVVLLGYQGQGPKGIPGKVSAPDVMTAIRRPGIYEMKPKDIDGKVVPLSKYRGKVMLIVNIAGKSAHADQLETMQKLYKEKSEDGLVVLAFPCADFGKEELRTNSEIKKDFTKKEYTYPLFGKMVVSDEKIDPLYLLLTRRGPERKEIEGNFVKFIVDRKGKIVERFPASVEPDNAEIKSAIDRELAKKS